MKISTRKGFYQIILKRVLPKKKKKKKRCIATIRDTFRQAYRNGLPFPPPEDLPDPGIKPVSLESPALASRLFTTEAPEKPSRFSG